MSSFAHDIAGGQGNLIATSVQSPNYSAGSAGWQIKKDGSAEFNNLVIRGTFNGTDFILNSTGLFLYSSTPASGNLIASFASSAGTDTFGNTFSGPGPFVYSGNNTGGLTAGALALANATDTFSLAADPTLDQLLLSALTGGMQFIFKPSLAQFTGGPLQVDSLLTYGAGGSGATQVVLTFNSSTTWVAPTGVTAAKVECWAGGGGGASSAGSGGGGGEYAAELANTVTAGNTYTITVGAGGAGGAGGGSNNGVIGGNSSFSGTGATTVTAHAGGGGPSGGASGGAKGTGSTNSTHHDGGTGGLSTGGAKGGGGGAGGGGSTANGSNGQAATSGGNAPGAGGTGGVSGGGGGSGGGWGGSSPTVGGTPSAVGGGGGGAGGWDGASNQKAGGAGAKGYVKVTYTQPAVAATFAAVAGTAGTDASSNAFGAGFTGQITNVQPGSNPVAVETWHSLGNFPSGTTTRGRYRIDCQGELELDINLTGTPTSGTANFPNTLPSAYRPAVTKRGVLTQGGTLGLCIVNTTGVVTLTVGAGGSTTADFAGSFPLD